jgi:hypothetical protein
MVAKLAKRSSSRPYERVKTRSRELERLLVSVEDSGKPIVPSFVFMTTFRLTHRDNFLLFLQRMLGIVTI